MSGARFETPTGVIDGVNTVFTVSKPYGPGTTAVFINGQLMEQSLDDGWFETDPQAGVITLKEAPRSSGLCPDVIQVFYLDTAPPLPETQLIRLKGVIRCRSEIRGAIKTSLPMRAKLRGSESLTGRVVERKRLRGTVEDSCKLRATIRVCGG